MKKPFLIVMVLSFSLLTQSGAYAQVTNDEVHEFRKFKIDDEDGGPYGQKETSEAIFERLKEKARERLKKKKRQRLLKTKTSARISSGYELNPAYDSTEKGDFFTQQQVDISWVPTFNEHFDADIGYHVFDQSYIDNNKYDTMYHTLSATGKYYPLENKSFLIKPGVAYNWILYPNDDIYNYDQVQSFIELIHFHDKNWQAGLRYEYDYLVYRKIASRDNLRNNLGITRADQKNLIDLWMRKNIKNLAVSMKVRALRNNSNDEYQSFYDYDSYRGYVTVSGSFLKDKKLYLSYTSDFEARQYSDRIADTTARYDNRLGHRSSAYYFLNSAFSVFYSVDYINANSNVNTGIYKNLINKAGVIINF